MMRRAVAETVIMAAEMIAKTTAFTLLYSFDVTPPATRSR